MSHMLDEIKQQPEAIERMAAKQNDRIIGLAKEIREKNIQFVMLAARGTSNNSAVYGKYMLGINNGLPAGLADPSAITLYNADMTFKNCLVVGVSQSGGSVDINEYLAHAKKSGAMTVGITNEYDSEITRVTDFAIFCEAEKEKSVAATKTYTTSLAAFYMLSQALAGKTDAADNLAKCAGAMRTVLGMDEQIKTMAQRYRYATSAISASRGYNYATSLEIALKLAETCYLKTRGYSAADLMHGPIASVNEGDPVIVVAPKGTVLEGLTEAAAKLKNTGAEMIIISADDKVLEIADTPIKLDIDVDEQLSPMAYTLPGQLFAHHLSCAKGNDPDKPRGLSKVTITR